MTRRIVVAITGATGAIYGVRLLAALREREVESHLVVSRAGWMTLHDEMNLSKADMKHAASVMHDINDVGATLASGSFVHDGMAIAPCSMKTLAAVAHGFDDNLITRAADVTLKERRKLLMLARETPLTLAHLQNMTMVTQMGGVVMPPLPAFYAKPRTVEDMVGYTVNRMLDQFGLNAEDAYSRWNGFTR